MACCLKLPLQLLSSLHTFQYSRNVFCINTFMNNNNNNKDIKLKFVRKSRILLNALTESNSQRSVEPDPQPLLQELSGCFNRLPGDYFLQLPRDLRLDLNDAAFDLSNGPVRDECGNEAGEILLSISRAWEKGDASTSAALMSQLPAVLGSLAGNKKAALGKRLLSSGRRFQGMGQYGQGEMQRMDFYSNPETTIYLPEHTDTFESLTLSLGIAEAMTKVGKLLSASPLSETSNEEPKQETRMFKFGELQVALTPQKAYIGAVISLVFGILSWEVSQGIQSIPESSLHYANENALMLGKSLRGALLAIFYASAILSGFATVGLVLLGQQLKSEEK